MARSAGREPRSIVTATAADLPVVLASVYISRRTLRLSSPRVENLERIEEALVPQARGRRRSIRREASPLPLRSSTPMSGFFGSHPVSIPTWRTSSAANRSNNTSKTTGSTARGMGLVAARRWLPHARRGRGDAVARAKLTAVVRLREQLGNRPSALLLYQGYPFDRLRRRLGLELAMPPRSIPWTWAAPVPASWIGLDPATL